MKLPKFLLAHNSDFPDDIFVVHTEYPRFVLNVDQEEVEWLDDWEGDDEETHHEGSARLATRSLAAAFKWCDEELSTYEVADEE